MIDDDEPEQLDTPLDPGEEPGDQKRRRRETRVQRETREREEFWRGVLSSSVGRRELWRTIFGANAAHVAEQRYGMSGAGFPDPNATWYLRGQKDLGDQVLLELSSIDHENVWKMQEEYDRRVQKGGK